MRKYLLATAASLGMIVAASGNAHAQAAKAPAPGTIEVHLKGALTWQMNVIGSSANNYNGYKLNPVGMAGFMRLYPGFDGTTMDGIQYGVASELRISASSAGDGVSGGSGNNNAFYVRRAYMYAGTKGAGFLRAGQTDGTWWLMSTGEYFNWGDHNNWDSDGGVAAAIPSQTAPKGLFTSTGVLYTTDKIVYLSPNIMGFQGGIDYEPNSNGFKEGIGCSAGSSGCATLASAPGGAGNARRKNRVDAAIEYTGTFSGVGVKASANYMVASPIGNSDGATIYTITSPQNGAQTGITSYKRLEVGMLSGQVTYAGFLLGGNIKEGQVNTGYKMLLPGQRQLMFYEVTGEYTMGPTTLAAMYFNNQSAGAYLPYNGAAKTETDYGLGLGANYALSKNFGVFAMYLYGHRHQAGYDFLSNTAGSDLHNNVQSQALTAGAKLVW